MVGRTLAHFDILEKLGEGGMGVVYKARDLQLHRIVALKLLLPEMVAEPERRRRFMHEARAVSALNHPNIITVYEIDTAEGVDYIAMEYVSGKTIGDLLRQDFPLKPARLNEVLKYALQMAGALAKAHQAGIVHRDLKPANIMVNQDGLVKLLDFGLAKLVEPSSVESSAPTRTNAPLTQPGVVVGTIAYMSPEQADGKEVDARSDIFSFGSVLYEMITGRRAFEREGKISTMSAILNAEPQPIRATVPAAPAALEQIVSRCLRKDPSRRFQHMDDLKVALEELQEESEQAARAPAAHTPPTDRSRTLRIFGLLAAAGAAAVAVWLAVAYFITPPEVAWKAVPITSEPGTETDASLSPDGNQVAYSWNGEKRDNFDIYVKLIGLPTQLRLTTEPGRDSNPAWSPDGRSIAFLRELPNGRAALITIPAIGGAQRKLAECYRPDLPFMNPSPAWSPDGKWLVIADKGSPQDPFELTLVSVGAGEKHKLTSSPAKTIGDSDAAFSPDGRWLAFVRTGSFLSSDLYVLALSADRKPKGSPRRLTFDSRVTAHPSWTPNGQEIVFSSGNPGTSSLWRIALSGRAPPRRLAYAGDEPISPSIAPQAHRLAYSHAIFDPNIWRLPLDGSGGRAGPAESVLSTTRIEGHPVYSPDGKRIAFESCRSGNYQIWVCDRDGSNAAQLTSFDGPIAGLPRWSPDGERLVFDSNAAGQYDVYVINANGGQPRRMTDDPADDQAPNWSNDGRWIYFASHRSGEPQIWKMPATDGAPAQVTKGGGHFPSESPDGKFLYYAKKGGLWRSPVAGGEESQVLDSLHSQSFAVTGQGIYFIKGPAASASIYFLRFSTGAVSTVYAIPKPVFFGLSVSPDARSILYTQIDQQGSDLMLVENFR